MLWSISRTPARWSSRTERTTSANSGTSASGSPAAGSSISTKAGSVRPGEADDRVPVQLERHILERPHALVGPRDGGGPKRLSGPPLDRFRHVAYSLGRTFAVTAPM